MRLVGRERSGATPTGAGEVLLKPARDALRAEQTARMAAAELTGLLTGTLRVGGSTIPAVYLLPGLLSAFREKHAGVEIHLVTGDSGEIIELIQSGDVDVGIVGTEPKQRGIQSRAFATDELVLIVPPKHELAGEASVGRESITGLPLVMREQGSGTRRAMLAALRLEDDHTLDVACHVGSTEAVKAAVRAGLGVSMVSRLSVEDEVAAGHLATIDLRGTRRSASSTWSRARRRTSRLPAGPSSPSRGPDRGPCAGGSDRDRVRPRARDPRAPHPRIHAAALGKSRARPLLACLLSGHGEHSPAPAPAATTSAATGGRSGPPRRARSSTRSSTWRRRS